MREHKDALLDSRGLRASLLLLAVLLGPTLADLVGLLLQTRLDLLVVYSNLLEEG